MQLRFSTIDNLFSVFLPGPENVTYDDKAEAEADDSSPVWKTRSKLPDIARYDCILL